MAYTTNVYLIWRLWLTKNFSSYLFSSIGHGMIHSSPYKPFPIYSFDQRSGKCCYRINDCGSLHHDSLHGLHQDTIWALDGWKVLSWRRYFARMGRWTSSGWNGANCFVFLGDGVWSPDPRDGLGDGLDSREELFCRCLWIRSVYWNWDWAQCGRKESGFAGHACWRIRNSDRNRVFFASPGLSRGMMVGLLSKISNFLAFNSAFHRLLGVVSWLLEVTNRFKESDLEFYWDVVKNIGRGIIVLFPSIVIFRYSLPAWRAIVLVRPNSGFH